ncbi:MAG: AgmX/PglI C-terminal domain-containing protein [Pseudomonadota bacterium]
MGAHVQTFYREYDLAWSVSETDRKRFNRFTLQVLGVTLVLALIIPVLPTFDRPSSRPEEVPERFVKLVIEKKKPPPPPPVVIPERPPEPVVQETPPEPKPVEEPKPKPEPTPPPPEPKPEQRVAEAREKAAKTGVMAFADDLAELRQHSAATVAGRPQALAQTVSATSRTERSLVTSGAASASGGINTASLSRNTGGTQLTGRQTTTVTSDVATAQVARENATGDAPASRSREEIEMVFDSNKAAIYALYRRALRNNPGLQGKLVLRLTIAPSGEVVDCEVVSSELGDPELESRLVRRVRLFNFGAKDVSQVTTTKPIEFFPA